MHPLETAVAETISLHNLFTKKDLVLIALSGGADSVALLRVIIALGYQVEALHCNFCLRGTESDADETFVRCLCDTLGVPLRVQRYATREYATKHKLSIEMAARTLRYNWFSKVLESQTNSAVVAVAHNSDDQIETLLLNLSTGTGLRGLSGMPYKRHDGIVRPIMSCSRTDILEYLQSLGQDFCEDSSNAELIYKRNNIRHRLIPLFEELNPAFRSATLRTIDHMRGVETIYLKSIESQRQAVSPNRQLIDIARLLDTPHPATLLYELLRPYNFTSLQCKDIAQKLEQFSSGKRYLSNSHGVVRSGNYLEIYSLNEQIFHELLIDISTSGKLLLPIGTLSWHIKPVSELKTKKCTPSEALFDWHKLLTLSQTLGIRSRHEGDVIYPYGMHGSKKLRRIFIDGHFSHHQRQTALLLTLNDLPIWLIGHIADRRYGLTESSTHTLAFQITETVMS